MPKRQSTTSPPADPGPCGTSSTAPPAATTRVGSTTSGRRLVAPDRSGSPARSTRVDPATGQIIAATDTASMPDGVIYKACGNRRATVCPSCSTVYQYDAYQLLRAGLAGGKTIPDTVSSHPAVFATFTAPSFGAVHSRVVTDAHLPRPDTLPVPAAALPHPPQPRHLPARPAGGLLHPAPRRRPGAR